MSFGLFISISILVFAFFNWLIHIIALVYSLRFFKDQNDESDKSHQPSVSIIKPLKYLTTLDSELEVNLESFFQLKYSNFEILFCIADEMDQSRPIVECLMQKYPKIKARLLIGDDEIGINPKLNNVYKAFKNNACDYIWLCDARIRVQRDSLSEMIDQFEKDSKIGLIHGIPVSINKRKNFGAKVEKIHFGGSFGRVYLAAAMFGLNTVTGMSVIFPTQMIDTQEYQTLAEYIAEDFFMGKMIQDKGYKLQLASMPAEQNSSEATVRAHFNRLKRWAKIRIGLNYILPILEVISSCFFLTIISSTAINYMLNINWKLFLLLHPLFWFLSDYLLTLILTKSLPGLDFFSMVSC